MDVNERQIKEIRMRGLRVREEPDNIVIIQNKEWRLLAGAHKSPFGLELYWVAKTEQAMEEITDLVLSNVI